MFDFFLNSFIIKNNIFYKLFIYIYFFVYIIYNNLHINRIMSGKITEKDYLMYFTSVRNLGLYISVALAILAVSRAYRGKSKLYNISFIVITLLFLMLSAYKNHYLILTLERMKMEIQDNEFYTNEISNVPHNILH